MKFLCCLDVLSNGVQLYTICTVKMFSVQLKQAGTSFVLFFFDIMVKQSFFGYYR